MAAGAAAMLAQQYAEQLAGAAENLLDKVPVRDEWESLRRMLQDTIGLLKGGNLSSGLGAFQRVLPYVGKVLYQVEKYMKLHDTKEITESVGEHFLVDEEAKEALEKCLNDVRLRMKVLKENIENFGHKLDMLLDGIMSEGEEVGLWTIIKMAFEMNRISAMIYTCDERLRQARSMIDDLDTHVAGKSFLAALLTYLCFLASLAFSATGNLPIGAACLATATATRKSARGLSDYRKRLAELDKEHKNMQFELNEWRTRFRAEQRNLLLVIGVKYSVLLLISMAAAFFVVGKAGNFLYFAFVFMLMVIKAEETNSMTYYAGLGIGVVAMVMEFQTYNGLIVFNTIAAMLLLCKFFSFLEIM